MSTIYVCGPMTGLPNNNYPMFNEVAAVLRARGHKVINPAENGVGKDWKWEDYMRCSITQIMESDSLYLLPSWEMSKGARLEVIVGAAFGRTFEDFYGCLDSRRVLRSALIRSLYKCEVD